MVFQPGEKTPGRLQCGLPVLKGGLKKIGSATFTQADRIREEGLKLQEI